MSIDAHFLKPRPSVSETATGKLWQQLRMDLHKGALLRVFPTQLSKSGYGLWGLFIIYSKGIPNL